jgi:exonuclease III
MIACIQVQDIRIRYDLPPDGTFQVTGYTTSNPVITGQAGSTTQGVGLLMQSEFNSFRELWGRMWRREEQLD